MSLAKGTMLGPYEVDILLGVGGMGEVYRARDTRLGRTVAIKVLLSGLTASSERRARFEREARVISALSDPHICALYDIGRDGDTEYLVMEYIEGETLAGRIARGRLPLSQVLRFGTEIAQALQHAHRAGITHRDLKPGNVMITSSGVKLLDFGLAKLANPEPAPRDSNAETIVNPLTAEGMVVGTLVYMSPEQLEGRGIDHRTDIFALGCILYEMATGQRPFSGSSAVAISAAILSSDPAPIRSLEPSTPPALERIVLTALEKNPEDRWQTAQDVARQLRWLSETSSATDGTPAIQAPRRSRTIPFVLLTGLAVGGLLAYGITRLLRGNPATAATVRLHLATTNDVQFVPSFESPNFALSPDGRTLCFAGQQGNTSALFLRRLDSFEVSKVEGSDDAWAPFWSSDGAWIGFSAHGKLWKTRAGNTSVPEPLCEVMGGGASASWVGKTILFADRSTGRNEIFRISDEGGTPVKAGALKPGEWRQVWPHLLSDERHFIYLSAAQGSLDRTLVLASLDSSASSALLKNISEATVVQGNRLVFVRDANLLTQRFDVDKGKLVGEPSLIANNVAYFYPSARAVFDAAGGTIVYRTNTSTGRLVMTDRKGASRVIDDRPFDKFGLSYSPDGKQAVVTVLNRETGLGDVWIYNLVRATRERITNDPGLSLAAIWTRDGRSLIYSRAGVTLPHLVRRSLTSQESEDLLSPGTFQWAGSFSPDGSTLYYTRESSQTQDDIFTLDMRTRKSAPFLNTTFLESEPQVSPDGKWIAFSSDTTGAREIYVQSLADSSLPRERISTDGGVLPRWRADGQELFYISSQDRVMSVVPHPAGQWGETVNTELFRQPANAVRFAPSPDGQSFLFVEQSRGAADSLFHVIAGWQ
ncbi:MAG TPA: protein kinase [Thermoanaerobaculia bacterium]|nr:protein kinase [Thermoanaerobaculia bacterium]